MKKGQWQYECECGFKLWHTVAKVELPEETIIELLTTGKTKKKIVGFTSKAGNVFDTRLKYEDDTIKFDFDNPGEEPSASSNEKKDNKVDFSDEASMLIELPPMEDGV
jgi:DNA topoisomerase-3